MNENEFEFNGVVYRTEKAIGNGSCLGCAFCDSDCCWSAPSCSSTSRSDGRNVIFVEVQNERAKG